MIAAVFVRRLKDGKTFDEFIEAWKADRGFGVPTRVFNATNLEDPTEVLSIGFMPLTPEQLAEGIENVAAQEAVRHGRIDDVIESTELKAMYEVETEHDFSDIPAEIDLGGTDSLLGPLQAMLAELSAGDAQGDA